jgi:O-antigen/teichoic acid export membrane protein
LSQFDKVLFLRLFDLQLLGIYGLAGNIAGPIESLISKISQLVLYPRCASNYRADLDTFSRKYYTENTKLFVSMLIVPAAVGGASHLIISVLYDPRYVQSALVLQAFMLHAVLLALASSAEDLLIAAGQSHIILVGNVYRAATLVVLSFSGYVLYGFTGFLYGTALGGLPPLLYYLWLQRAKGFLVARYEIYKVALLLVSRSLSYLASEVLLTMWPAVLIKAY